MPWMDNPLVVSLIMVLFGILVKYMPALKDWPNRLIIWCNLLIGIMAKLVAPEPVNAGFFSNFSHSWGWWIVPIQTVVARQIYEAFIRPTLEQFGILGYPSAPVPVKVVRLKQATPLRMASKKRRSR